MHPHIPASDITYLVVEPPMHGYLEVLPNQIEGEEEPGDVEDTRPVPVTLFDQSLIDDKRVHYIQAAANRTRDKFIVDVTNGISWLRGETSFINELGIYEFPPVMSKIVCLQWVAMLTYIQKKASSDKKKH